MAWLEETYRLVQQDRRDTFLTMMSLVPIARTPMDKQGGRWLQSYSRDVRKMLFSMTPWDSRGGAVRSSYAGKVKRGTIAVVLDDPRLKDDPTFKGAKTIKG